MGLIPHQSSSQVQTHFSIQPLSQQPAVQEPSGSPFLLCLHGPYTINQLALHFVPHSSAATLAPLGNLDSPLPTSRIHHFVHQGRIFPCPYKPLTPPPVHTCPNKRPRLHPDSSCHRNACTSYAFPANPHVIKTKQQRMGWIKMIGLAFWPFGTGSRMLHGLA